MPKTEKESKSVAKRLKVQKAAEISAPTDRWEAMEARIKVLEAKQAAVTESFDFLANECRPIYGMGGLALIFDAVTKRLRK